MFKKLALKWLESRFLKGKITYIGIGSAALAFGLDKLGLVQPVCDAVAVGPCDAKVIAAYLIAVGVAVAGKLRADHQAQ